MDEAEIELLREQNMILKEMSSKMDSLNYEMREIKVRLTDMSK